MITHDKRGQRIFVPSPEMVAEAKLLLSMEPSERLGLIAETLRQMTVTHPMMVREIFNYPLIKEGFRGESLLQQLQRVCR